MSYLAGPAVPHKDGRPEVSRTGVDRILPSRPVQGSWQSPRRALRGPRTVENTALVTQLYRQDPSVGQNLKSVMFFSLTN